MQMTDDLEMMYLKKAEWVMKHRWYEPIHTAEDLPDSFVTEI